MGLGINYVIRANHMISLITSSTTDPSLDRIHCINYVLLYNKNYNIVILCLILVLKRPFFNF